MMQLLGAFVFVLLGMALGWRVGRGRRPSSAGGSPPLGTSADHVTQIFEHTMDGLFLIEVLGPERYRNLAINPALLQLMGMRAEQLVGRLVHETGVPAEAARFVARYRRCVEAAAVQREHITIELPAGRRVVEMTLVPLRDATGRIHQLVGVVHDLTDRVALEAALAARESEFRTLVENSPDLIVRYDLEGRRVYVNPAFERMHREPAKQLLGKTAADDPLLGDGVAARMMEGIRDVVAHGKTLQVGGIKRKFGETWREGDLLLVPEVDADGRVQTVLALVRDLTSLRRQQDELAQSRAQLRQLTASLVSRELNEELGQVLTALRLSAGMLRVQYADSLPPLLAASNAMTELVDSAIGTMRELVGRLRPAVLDDGLLPALIWAGEQLRLRHGLACRLDVAAVPDLNGEEAVALLGVAREALGNVARHAGVARAELALTRTGDRWELSVRDTGCGFDPATVDQATFGLKLMREGAHLLRGELQIASRPGEGTQVRLSFPAQSL
jgi:PAS domain S-box-containing protein